VVTGRKLYRAVWTDLGRISIGEVRVFMRRARRLSWRQMFWRVWVCCLSWLMWWIWLLVGPLEIINLA